MPLVKLLRLQVQLVLVPNSAPRISRSNEPSPLLHVARIQFVVRTLLITIALALYPTATRAQDWSCANADNLPQQGMNYCAYKDYEKADAELNATWKRVFPQLKAYDADLDEIHKGLPQAVLQAQRAWIKYRDAHCEAEGFKVRGGTLEPLIVSSCLAHLTRTRTKQIADLLQDGL